MKCPACGGGMISLVEQGTGGWHIIYICQSNSSCVCIINDYYPCFWDNL